MFALTLAAQAKAQSAAEVEREARLLLAGPREPGVTVATLVDTRAIRWKEREG